MSDRNGSTATAAPGGPALLTPAEAMARLRVSRQTLLRYEASGILATTKLPSGHRRYHEADVIAIEQGEVSA